MRLIDADALRKVISGLQVIITGVRYGRGLLVELVTEYCRNILKAIDEAPTIDAVEVVRCKDCKHYVQFLRDKKECRCTIFSGCYDRPYPTEPDDFCSYGERKDNG